MDPPEPEHISDTERENLSDPWILLVVRGKKPVISGSARERSPLDPPGRSREKAGDLRICKREERIEILPAPRPGKPIQGVKDLE